MSCKRCEEKAAPAASEGPRRGASGAGRAAPRAATAMADAPRRGGLISRACDQGAGGCGGGHAAAKGVPAASGRALDARTRAPFEARMGRGFGDVRIHDGGDAAQAARGIGARAFTVGRDIVFGAGQFRPGEPGARGCWRTNSPMSSSRAAATPDPRPSWRSAHRAMPMNARPIASPMRSSRAARRRRGCARRRWYRWSPRCSASSRALHLDLPPPPLIRPGSIREAWVIPAATRAGAARTTGADGSRLAPARPADRATAGTRSGTPLHAGTDHPGFRAACPTGR